MRTPPSKRELPELSLCLALTPRAAPLRAFSQILDKDEEKILRELTTLCEQNLVLRHEPTDRWSAADDYSRQTLGKAGFDRLPEAQGALFHGLRLLWSGETLEGCERVFQRMGELLRRGDSAGALMGLEILFIQLRGWRHREHGAEENSAYLRAVHRVLGISLYMTETLNMTEELIPTALPVAMAMGDKRMELRIRLIKISHEYLAGGAEVQAPGRAMEDVIADIRELGDPDILSCTAYGIGLQHYARGEFVEAIASLWDHAEEKGNIRFSYFGGMSLLAVSSSACALGRFDIALGRTVGHLRQLGLKGTRLALKRVRIQAADVLLRTGFEEEALEMMSDAFACCDTSAEARLCVWGFRNLAYYHFRRKNLIAAHTMLRRGVRIAQRHGLNRPYFGFSEIYEMLWSFKEHGLEDMPGCYGLEHILQYSLASSNSQWQGQALQVRARQLLNRGGKRETAIEWLRDSLHRLKAAGNPLESARTGLLLAENLRAAGRSAEARALQFEYGPVPARLRQHDADPALCVRPGPPEAGACAARCSKTFSELPPWISFEAHMQSLADGVLDAVRAERAAMFALDENRVFHLLAARHISVEERESAGFARHFKLLAGCVRQNRIHIRQSRQGVWLYMPLSVAEGCECALLLHCAYLVEHLTGQKPECFETLRGLLETELRLAYRLQRNIETRQVEEEKRVKLAEERLGKDDLYYGPSMREVLNNADKAAGTDAPALILGETGVGKEELARRVHRNSGRAGAFIAVHPASIPEALFESELFGHEKGAFTGAHRQKLGLIELADKGTLFIDELADIPAPLQVKLLRVLQNKLFRRVGGTRETRSDFRLMSATNRDIERMAREGRFREDLYYRVAVVPLYIPPLRRRPEDIRRLAEMFLARFAARYRRSLPPLMTEELKLLCAYQWPGNIRELKSVIERAVILYDSSRPLFHGEALFPSASEKEAVPVRSLMENARPAGESACADPGNSGPLHYLEPPAFDRLMTMEELQRGYIRYVLTLTRGKIDGRNGALEILGMKRSTLYAKIRQYGLDKASLLYGRSLDREDQPGALPEKTEVIGK